MPLKPHGRQYDLVVFGASGYTGVYTAEHIAAHLPTNLKWAVAGRSREKLERLAEELNTLRRDRLPVGIETCNLNGDDLDALAKKTYILITTVGPYGAYGEYAFKACAENGTHYIDCTGEVPFVARMIEKYDSAAKSTNAMLFPQIGIESAPADLLTWYIASLNRTELSAHTKDVTVSIHTLHSVPSGGTLATVFTLLENFSLKELEASLVPFALSPVANPKPAVTKRSWLSRVTGVSRVPNLGLLTTSIAGRTDAAIVGRGWGLLSTIPSRKEQFYGPNFSFREFMRARGWWHGMSTHFALMLFGIVLITPPLRKLAKRLFYQPGDGPDKEEAKKDVVEYRGVGNPDLGTDVSKQAFARVRFEGSLYCLTAVLMAQAASTLLEDDVKLEGGIYTSACLGQPYIDRLDAAGFKFESKIIPMCE